jgi:uncharacterized protein
LSKILRRLLISLLLLGLLLYLLACGFLYSQQKRLLYFPVPLSAEPNGEAFMMQNQGVKLRGWVINPNQSRALLYFGGNAEQVERNAEFFRECLPTHSVYLLPYRGYGVSEGEPEEEAMLDDALKLHDHARTKHAMISVMGRSLGSGIANYVAAKREVQKTVLVTPYDSIVNVAAAHYPAMPISLLITERFESDQFARENKASALLVVAGRDEVIPPEHALQLAAAFKEKPRVEMFGNATHNSISDEPGYREAVCGFLN